MYHSLCSHRGLRYLFFRVEGILFWTLGTVGRIFFIKFFSSFFPLAIMIAFCGSLSGPFLLPNPHALHYLLAVGGAVHALNM